MNFACGGLGRYFNFVEDVWDCKIVEIGGSDWFQAIEWTEEQRKHLYEETTSDKN